MNKWALSTGEALSARVDICSINIVYTKQLHTDGPRILNQAGD